jgi:hypothetical protein
MARRRPTEPTANPARGAILVVAAVLLGIFLLRHGLDTSVDISGTPKTTTDGGTAGATTSGSSSTSTSLAVRPPAQVPSIVLNGTATSGAAKKYSDALFAAGYNLTNRTGATATAHVTTTEVLYAPGFQKEASAVATAIGAPQTAVAPLGTTLPGSTSGADVIVVLGPDLATTTPPTASTTSTTV